MANISLTEEDFIALINGQIINKVSYDGEAIKIGLQDIGVDRILKHATEAANTFLIKTKK